jgi:hypothetical protein
MGPHLDAILADLKQLFGQALLGVTRATVEAQPDVVKRFVADDFFDVTFREPNTRVGEQFRALYAHAAATCDPDRLLHLCFIDRVAFALETAHRLAFIADAASVASDATPLMFHRSEVAWTTHPRNYREIEGMTTRAGEMLFDKTLDFAWCHLVIQAGLLRDVLRNVSSPGMSVLAEITLILRDRLRTRPADWLSWEDPFLLGCDPDELKHKRENSVEEVRKRFKYVVPMLQLIANAASSETFKVERS